MTTTSPQSIDQSQASQFHHDGFVLLPGLLAPGQLEHARAEADRTVAKPAGLSCERPNNTLLPLRWDDTLTELVLASHHRISTAIGARDLRWISGYVSVKEPHSPPLWWHQDWWAWEHPVSFRHDPVQVAVLCYLSYTTVQTGALRVLPGSHAASVPLHRVLPEAHSDESTALDLGHPAMIDQPGQITLELHAGDAVVTDYRLLHGTHAHSGPYRRDCVLLSFTPHWNELPDDIRGHLISHPALPQHSESGSAGQLAVSLPTFDGPRRDLPLNRNAPPSSRSRTTTGAQLNPASDKPRAA